MEAVNIEHKKVPKLRFPGFEGEWELKIIGDLTQDVSYGMNSAAIEFDGINKYLRITDIDVESRMFVPNPLTSPNGELEDKYLLKMRDIVFARTGASVGKCYLYNDSDGKLYYAGFLIKFSIIEDAEPYFIYSYTFGGNYMKWVKIMSMRSGQPGINSEEYKSLKFYIPTLPEQQKIATFLSVVDKKIQQLTRKKKLLEQYKKSVMQKIFSQEIRFRDENGNDYPEWEEKRLGDILTFISTNSLSRNDLNYESGEIKNIHYGDIHTTFKMGFDVEKEKVPFINEEVDLRKITKDQFCQVGDIVVADASEDYSDIGKAIEVLNVGNERIVAGLHTFLARDTVGQTIKGFKGYLFQTWQVRKQIMKVAQGISVLGISKKNLAKVEFLLPCREEQGKITTLLKNIDKRISNSVNQINQTQQFKKGLLQQLFV